MRSCLPKCPPNCVLSSHRKPCCLTCACKPFSTIHRLVSPAANPTTSKQTTPECVPPSIPGNSKTPIQFVGTSCQSPQKMQMHSRTQFTCRTHKTCRCMRGDTSLAPSSRLPNPRNPSTTPSKFSSQAASVFSARRSHRDGRHRGPQLPLWGDRQWDIIKQLFFLVLSLLHTPSSSGSLP